MLINTLVKTQYVPTGCKSTNKMLKISVFYLIFFLFFVFCRTGRANY